MTPRGAGSLVVDTHAAIWYLQKDPRLSPNAERDIDVALGNGHPVYVPSISVVELIYLIDKGRIPEAAFDLVTQVLRDPDSGFRLAPLDLAVAVSLRRILREEIPDLPDRVVAATALALNLPLVTCDEKIRASGLQTIW